MSSKTHKGLIRLTILMIVQHFVGEVWQMQQVEESPGSERH